MLDDKYLSEIYKINKEWSEKTHFELEEDKIRKIVQRDCNNYVMITTDGKIKFKGGELNNYNPTGEIRWKKHNLEICAEALVKKLLYDIPIEETINACNELSKFQMISKVGHTYKGCKRLINGEYIPWQKVNRLYACIDDRYGNELYKCKDAIKKDVGIYERHDKVANCPHNTMIDGYDEISIDILDKQWYIDYTTNKYEKFIEN